MKRTLFSAFVALFACTASAYTIPSGYFAVMQFRNGFFMLSQAPCADPKYAADGWRKALYDVPAGVGKIHSCWYYDEKTDAVNVCWIASDTGKLGGVCEWHPRRAYISVSSLPAEAEISR